MPFDPWAQRADPALLPERMDDPGAGYAQLRACLRDLEQVNRLTGAYRPTLAWLGRLVEAHRPSNLRIVDLGCGRGDFLRRIAHWARARGLRVQLTGVDLNPYAIRAAQEASTLPVEWITGDVRSLHADRPVDVVLSSLVMHHLPESEIVETLAWAEHRARLGWFFNDLERSPVAARSFRVLGALLRWHPFVRHDGPVSFRRAFREDDWRRLCALAGVSRYQLEHARPARLCVGHLKDAR